MAGLRITRLDLSKEVALGSGRDIVEFKAVVESDAAPQPGLSLQVRFQLVTGTDSFVIGTVPCRLEFGPMPSSPSLVRWRALAALAWTTGGPQRYQVRARAIWRLGAGPTVEGEDVAHPRLLVLLAPPDLHVPEIPAEAISRPRGSRSPLPRGRTNLAHADTLGLRCTYDETGYPLAELPELQDEVRRVVKLCADPVMQTGLSRQDHVFSAVFDPAASGDPAAAGDGLPPLAAVQRSRELVAQGRQQGDGYEREEQMVSLFRDAIEMDPNNLQAYLDIVTVQGERLIPPDLPRARRYFFNLYMRLISALTFVGPVLIHGDPERQSALRIWDRVGVYVIGHMRNITRVRRAYASFPTLGAIQEVRRLGTVLELHHLLNAGPLTETALAWFQIPATEKFSEAELTLLVPHLNLVPLDDYVRRRWPRLDAITYGWVYESAWKMFAPVQYAVTPEANHLRAWIAFLQQGAPGP